MIWFIITLAALAVLVVALTHLSVWVGRRQAKHEEEEERYGDHHNRDRHRNLNQASITAITAGVNAIGDELEAQRRQQNHHEKSRASLEKIGVFAAIIAAILAGLSAWIFSGQLEEMRNEQRPWVSADFGIGGVQWINGEARITLLITLKNSGHSPGLFASTVPEVYAWFDIKRLLSKQKEAASQRKHAQPIIGTPVFPGDNISTTWTVTLSRDEIEEFRKEIQFANPSGTLPFVPTAIVVIIDYRANGLGEHHQTGYILTVSYRDSSVANAPILPLPVGKDLAAKNLVLSYFVRGQYAN